LDPAYHLLVQLSFFGHSQLVIYWSSRAGTGTDSTGLCQNLVVFRISSLRHGISGIASADHASPPRKKRAQALEAIEKGKLRLSYTGVEAKKLARETANGRSEPQMRANVTVQRENV